MMRRPSHSTTGEEVRLQGLVLSRSVLPDGSKRVELLTDVVGRIYAVARSAARISQWSGLFEPLTWMELTVTAGRDESGLPGFGVFKIISADFLSDFPALKRSPAILARAAPFVTLVHRVVQPGEPAPHILKSLLSCLKALPRCAEPTDLYVFFNYLVLKDLGGTPRLPNLESICKTRLCKEKLGLLRNTALKRRLVAGWAAALGVDMGSDLLPVSVPFQAAHS